MDNFKISIDGLDNITKALAELPEHLGSKIIGSVNRDILNRLVKPQLQSSIPYSHPIYKATVKVQKQRRSNTAYKVGFTTDVYWLRFMEKGTKSRTTKAGQSRGAITSPKPFIGRIYDGSVSSIMSDVAKEYGTITQKMLLRRLKSVNRRLNKF